jgi:hypothetical protein
LSKSFLNIEYWSIKVGEPVDELIKWWDILFERGILEHTDDGGFTIHNWQKYQEDPTSSDRVARYRDRKRELRDVTLQSVTPRCVTGETPTGQDRTRQDRTVEGEGSGEGEAQLDELASPGTLSLGFEEPDREPDQDAGHQLPPNASPRLLAIVEAMKRAEFDVPGKGPETIWKNAKRPAQLAANLEKSCPGVDVPALIDKLAGWTVANPGRAKRDLGKFLWNAAIQDQEKPRFGGAPTSTPPVQSAIEIEMRRVQALHDKKYGKQPVQVVLTQEETEAEMSRMQAEWDRVHGTKPAAE